MEAVETAPAPPDEKVTKMQVAEPESKKPEVKEQNLIAKFETRSLRHDFSAIEKEDIGQSMSQHIQNRAAIAAEKKTVVAQYAAKDKEEAATIDKLAGQFKDGYEMREVKCEVVLNQPENGKKSLIRSDTKTVIIEKMTQFDFNSQYKQGSILDEVEKNDSDVSSSDHFEKDNTEKNKGKFVKGRQSTDILNMVETGADKPSKSTAGNTKKGKGKRVAQSAEAPSGIIEDNDPLGLEIQDIEMEEPGQAGFPEDLDV